jgi:hypothetical protein
MSTSTNLSFKLDFEFVRAGISYALLYDPFGNLETIDILLSRGGCSGLRYT